MHVWVDLGNAIMRTPRLVISYNIYTTFNDNKYILYLDHVLGLREHNTMQLREIVPNSCSP
jgi:hypothetical protein